MSRLHHTGPAEVRDAHVQARSPASSELRALIVRLPHEPQIDGSVSPDDVAGAVLPARERRADQSWQQVPVESAVTTN